MSELKKSISGPKTIFRWEIQVPFGLLCVGTYFYFVASEGRKEPVLAGIGYGAIVVGICEFFMRRRVQKENTFRSEVRPNGSVDGGR